MKKTCEPSALEPCGKKETKKQIAMKRSIKF